MSKAWILSVTIIVLTGSQLQGALDAGAPVAHRVIPSSSYDSFVKNWDDATHPVLYARIRTPADWNTVLNAAAYMGNKHPFAPDEKFFKAEQLLVIARVVPGNDMNKALKIESVRATADELAVRYRYAVSAGPKATSTVKACLYVAVPQRDYKRIVFVENGLPVGELKAGDVTGLSDKTK